MSELREECYKCLNNQSCPSAADYGSIICMTRRKYKMPRNEEDSVYATKFAVMQQQIDERDKRIKELEEKNSKLKKYCKEVIKEKQELTTVLLDSIPVQKVNDEIEKYEYMLAETIHGEIQRYTPGEILLKIDTLKEILEDK